MKALMQTDALPIHPDHNKPFHMESEASKFQLGAVIKQEGLPDAFHIRKLDKAQKNHTTMKKELLSVVKTFKEFHSMLLGAEIHVHIDHKNIIHKPSSFTSQRILCQKILLKEFNPTFHYISGPKNVVANSLSQTPISNISCSH